MHLAGALPANPSLGVCHPKHEVSRSARAERERWTSEEVRRLLESPLITGKGTYRLLRGDLTHDPEAYWLTLLLAYTGMRPEEAAQLEVNDFGALEGIHCLVVWPSNGRRAKNNASIRVLPIPTVLLQLGLLRLVEERRAAGGRRPFPNLTRARGKARIVPSSSGTSRTP